MATIEGGHGSMVSTPEEVLACPMGANDSGAATVREYLAKLLYTLWDEEEGFSGKRPFGNSGWQYEVYAALGKAGYIACSFDEDGYIEGCDDEGADKLILEAIETLGV